eukprot:7224508-Prymnesium_polylepis.1
MSAHSGEHKCIMPSRPRACTHRPPTNSMGAHGSAVTAAGMSAQQPACVHACMCGTGACCAPAAADD